MTQKKIDDGNVLIFKFMYPALPEPDKTELYFHDHWDWIMPVVENIESMGFDVSIYGDQRETEASILKPTAEDVGRICFVKHRVKIAAVFLACVEFIKKWKP